jgi:hypothetical protein
MAEKSNAILDLGQHYRTADEIAEGRWVKLDCGLKVLVARTNSPEFQKYLAQAQNKFAKRKDKIPPDKVRDATIYVMARACFKEFAGPNGEQQVAVGKETLDNNLAGREWILRNLPDLAEEIAEFAGLSAEEFEEELESAGKA